MGGLCGVKFPTLPTLTFEGFLTLSCGKHSPKNVLIVLTSSIDNKSSSIKKYLKKMMYFSGKYAFL